MYQKGQTVSDAMYKTTVKTREGQHIKRVFLPTISHRGIIMHKICVETSIKRTVPTCDMDAYLQKVLG